MMHRRRSYRHACRLAGLLALLAASPASAGLDEALAALRAQDYETAYREFVPLAEAGDTKAMTTIGLFFYEGDLPQDYGKAMSWFVRAMERGDGDAYNNIGVMYRDGLGVEVNREIAYDLFLIVHMRGLGSQNTQLRANRNLRREVAELDTETIRRALCHSEQYVLEYVRSRAAGQPAKVAPTPGSPGSQVRIRDKDWWLAEERKNLTFDCEGPAR